MDMNEAGQHPKPKPLSRFMTSLCMATLVLASCGQPNGTEPSARDGDVPRKILISFVEIDPKTSPSSRPSIRFYSTMVERSGRCCNIGDSFQAKELPAGMEMTSSLVAESADGDSVLYLVTLSELSDISLVEGVFGPSPRELELPPKITECRVMAGVREGMLRAGTLKTRESTAAQESRCNMVAMLLLLGLPEEEALDYEKWSEPAEERFSEPGVVLPRRDAINQYAACLDGGRYRDLFLTVESCP